jgi:hypothetical protein
MIQVYRIPVPKERLPAMPKDERVLLLLLGYNAAKTPDVCDQQDARRRALSNTLRAHEPRCWFV